MSDAGVAVEMDTKDEKKTVAKRRKAKSTAPATTVPASDAKKKPTKAKVEGVEATPRQSVESVRYENDDAERAAAQKIFKEFDRDSSGSIDTKELSDLCRKVGRPLTKKELADALTVLDKDKNGSIDFEEFYNWFSDKLTGTATPRHMMLADVRRKMRRYTASNVVMDTLGPAFGVVVPTDWSWGRMVQESQSAWSRFTAGTVFESSKKKRVRAIFNKYDTDKSGELDLDEFGVFCADLGEKFTTEQLEVALAEIDEDGNGTVDFEEFYKWWCADPAHEDDADWGNRVRNTMLGYRDTKPVEEAATKSAAVKAKAGGSGDPGLIAENRRLKAQVAQMQQQLNTLTANNGTRSASPQVQLVAPGDDSSDSFEALDKGKGDDGSSSSDDDAAKPTEQAPRKKKGKRKSRKPQKLEDSDDYETSEDQGSKVRKN